MNKLETTLLELANMVTSAEHNLKKDKGHVMVVSKSSTHKKGQRKGPKRPWRPSHRRVLKKDKKSKGTYHYCNKDGH